MFPDLAALCLALRKWRHCAVLRCQGLRCELDGEFEFAVAGLPLREMKLMRANLADRRIAARLPPHRGEIAVVVERPLQLDLLGSNLGQRRAMGRRLRPIRRGEGPRTVGKLERDLQPLRSQQRRHDSHGEGVPVAMAQRRHFDRHAVQRETTADFAPPQVERLIDGLHVARLGRPAVGLGQYETDLSQMQPVGIAAEPRHFGRPFVAGNVGVPDLPPVGGELREAESLDGPLVGIGEAMPTPLRQRAPRNRPLIRLRNRLQPRGIDGEGELSVADRQRRLDVERMQHDVVALDEGPAVDRLGVRRRLERGQR